MDNNHVKPKQTKLKKQGHTTTLGKLKHTTENIINQMQTSLHNYIKNYKSNALSISTGTKHSKDNSGIYFIKAKQPITTCSSRNNLLSPIPIIIENQQYKNKYTTLRKLNAERTAVSLRRMQYAHEIKNVKYKHKYKGKVNQIVSIQQWWKYLYKVIVIQSIIRGCLFRKKLFVILNQQNRVIHGLIKIKDALVKHVNTNIFKHIIHPYHVVMKLYKLIMTINQKKIKVSFWKWFMCYLQYTQFNKKVDMINMDDVIMCRNNMSFCKDSDRDNMSLSFQNEIINTNIIFGSSSSSSNNNEVKTKTERTVIAVKLNKHKGRVYENKLNVFTNDNNSSLKKTFYIKQDPDTKLIPHIMSNVLLSPCVDNIYKVCMLKICFNKHRNKIVKCFFIKWKQFRFIFTKPNKDLTYIKPNHSFVSSFSIKTNHSFYKDIVFKKPKITKHYNYNHNTNNSNTKTTLSTHSVFVKWHSHLQSKTYSNKSISTAFTLYILHKLIKFKQHALHVSSLHKHTLMLMKVYKKEMTKKWLNIWKQHSNGNTCIDNTRSLYTKKHHFSHSSKSIFHNNNTITTPITDVNAVVVVAIPKHNTTHIHKVACNHKKSTTNVPSPKECDDVYQLNNTNTNSTNITCLTDSFMQSTPYIKSKVINFSKK